MKTPAGMVGFNYQGVVLRGGGWATTDGPRGERRMCGDLRCGDLVACGDRPTRAHHHENQIDLTRNNRNPVGHAGLAYLRRRGRATSPTQYRGGVLPPPAKHTGRSSWGDRVPEVLTRRCRGAEPAAPPAHILYRESRGKFLRRPFVSQATTERPPAAPVIRCESSDPPPNNPPTARW